MNACSYMYPCVQVSWYYVVTLTLSKLMALCVHLFCVHPSFGHFRPELCVVCVTTGYDVFTSVRTRVHIVCTAYGWVCHVVHTLHITHSQL